MPTADPVRVSVVSPGNVEIHPEHAVATGKALYWWLLTSLRWLPERRISLLVRRRTRPPLLLVGDLTYGADRLERRQVPGVGVRRELARTSGEVLALAERIPGLVVLPAHDPTAAQRLLESAA